MHDCPWGSSSPTGQVPALDTEDGQLIGATDAESVFDEFEGAAAIVAALKKSGGGLHDLDAHLSPAGRADAAAFTTLLQTKLVPALIYSTWCEPDAYAAITRPAFGAGLPFPLNLWLPHSARKAAHARLAALPPHQIYESAAAAIDAIAAKLLLSAADDYALGDRPSSLDATLFGCLAYLRSSPAVHPDLRAKLTAHRSLERYVERLAERHFQREVPRAEEAHLEWGSWGPGAGGRRKAGAAALNLDLNRKGKMWLAAAGAATLAYVLLSGQYISYSYLGDLGDDDDEYDDE